MGSVRQWLAAFVLGAAWVCPMQAQEGATTRTVVIGPQYSAGALHSFLFGGEYRDLWTAPVQVEVLDLARFAGGLTPLEEGGGQQTRSLRFLGGDGREYAFRSVDKDPALSLPPVLRQTAAANVMRDQTSAAHPAAPLVVAPLLQAVGVLHASPRLVVLPDDAALGTFRERFGGLVGMIEERPNEAENGGEGFAGATQVVGTDRFLKLIEDKDAAPVDARAYLVARLMDMFLGDWDRHNDQWRWALVDQGGGPHWLPIPRDRDQALSRINGLLPSIAIMMVPQLVSFGEAYPAAVQLSWSGRVLDRRLLPALERAVWDSITSAIQANLTDSVIDAAVGRLPAAYVPLDADRLSRTLRHRRDKLPVVAERFYRLLAAEVDVHLTDGTDYVNVVREDDQTLTVEASRPSGEVTFRRRFDAKNTGDLRLYLHGGDDLVIIRGEGDPPITLRVIGGSGRDTLADSSGVRGVRFYDDTNSITTTEGNPAPDTRQHPAPVSGGTPDAPQDFGSLLQAHPVLMLVPDVGLLAGGGVTHTRFGFGKTPFARRISARIGYAAGADVFLAEAAVTWRQEHANGGFRLAARTSGIEVLHFYGFGNETPDGPRERFAVRQQQYRFDASVEQDLAPGWRLAVGPTFGITTSDLAPGTLVAEVRPYGTETFGQVGLRVGLDADTRDRPAAPSRGYRVRLEGSVYPGFLDVSEAFAELHGDVSTVVTLPIPTHPALAIRAGGKRVWGPVPLHEAAFLGGVGTVRGYAKERFTGRASAFGGAELRVPVARFFFVLPGEFGVYGLAEGGRVWVEDDSSDKWHGAKGGGIWFAFLDRAATVTMTAVRSVERTTYSVRAGFGW